MNKEEKELLIKDLCGRSPYGVKIYDIKNGIMNLICVNGIVGEVFISYKTKCRTAPIEDIKPYLFPLSSMTEEQKNEYKQFLEDIDGYAYSIDCVPQIDWLNKNHFDYRGLIEKSLALNATNLDIYKAAK